MRAGCSWYASAVPRSPQPCRHLRQEGIERAIARSGGLHVETNLPELARKYQNGLCGPEPTASNPRNRDYGLLVLPTAPFNTHHLDVNLSTGCSLARAFGPARGLTAGRSFIEWQNGWDQ